VSKSEAKSDFANFLADRVFLGMTECERYGMTWGCDIDCPVLRDGRCELKDSDNKELYDEFLCSGK
jgi:hypothetical protein